MSSRNMILCGLTLIKYSCSPCCFHVICIELYSELRQVPDNQEVYVDTNSDMSIVVELLTLEPGESMLSKDQSQC
jgi:Ran-interacting Mog1 protein